MLDATSSLSSPWQMFLKHMKKVLLLRILLPRPARPNPNSDQPMFVFILYIFGISHRADHITVFFRRTWNSRLLWAISYSVLLVHFPFSFRLQGNPWRSNIFYSGAKTDLFCVYFFLPLCQQRSHEQIITLHKSFSHQIRLTNVLIEVYLLEDSPHSTFVFTTHALYAFTTSHFTSITRQQIYVSTSQHIAYSYAIALLHVFPDPRTFLFRICIMCQEILMPRIQLPCSLSSPLPLSWHIYLWFIHSSFRSCHSV